MKQHQGVVMHRQPKMKMILLRIITIQINRKNNHHNNNPNKHPNRLIQLVRISVIGIVLRNTYFSMNLRSNWSILSCFLRRFKNHLSPQSVRIFMLIRSSNASKHRWYCRMIPRQRKKH